MTKLPNTFAFNLLQQMGTKGQNIFFSPYSIKACMALLYEGARGATEAQMASVFGFSDRFTEGGKLHQELLALKAAKGSSLALRIANSIWLDQKPRSARSTSKWSADITRPRSSRRISATPQRRRAGLSTHGWLRKPSGRFATSCPLGLWTS